MPDILFKGFHPDEKGKSEITLNGKKIKGEYVEGFYQPVYNQPDKAFIGWYEREDQIIPTIRGVIPETVGQFTGKTLGDEKLFVGDVVECYEDYDDSWGYPKTSVFRAMVIFDDENFCYAFKTDEYLQPLNDWTWDNTTIIGTIHEHPEFAKGGAK